MRYPMRKACCLVGAFCGAAVLSQYPTFTQQYVQRLGGQVDALADVVADFDASALEAGLTRTAALDEMTGTSFLDARAADMRRTFARHVILTDQLSRLRTASAMDRIWMAPELRDAETLRATWADFEPAVPMTAAGAATGIAGFVGGWAAMAGVLGLLRLPFRRRRPQPARQAARVDPPVYRPDAGPRLQSPRLMGETRP